MSSQETSPPTDGNPVTLDAAVDLFEKTACQSTYQMREGVKAVSEFCEGRVVTDPAPPNTVPKFKFDTLVEHCKRQDVTIAKERARNNDLELYQDNAVWHWQNDGQDFLESLTCPIVIPAAQLRALMLENTHGGFTKRLSDLADKMSVIVNKAEAETVGLRILLANLINHVDSITCQHESTHRGGAIWTICDDCDKKWADDRGGFVPYTDAPALAAARAALEPVVAAEPAAPPAPQCNNKVVRVEGKPYPRSCAKCGLGPCHG